MTRGHTSRWHRLRTIDEIGVIVALLSVCTLLILTVGEKFGQPGNLLQVARQASSYGIMAVGMVLLLAMGQIDLSVGSILTLVNIVSALLLREGVAIPVALAAGVAAGVVCGLLNGLLTV